LKQGQSPYSFTVYGARGVAHRTGAGYEPAVRAICEFFATRKPPVSREETIDLFAFMEAADESQRRGGVPVPIAEIVERAKRDLASRRVHPGGDEPRRPPTPANHTEDGDEP
jgi:hypothetical protein